MLPISIVIATYNRCEELRKTLAALHDLGTAHEIIVVNNGSSDGTAHMVQAEFSAVRLIDRSDNGGVPAFELGAREASQPYILLLDDDAVPEQAALDRVVGVLDSDARVAIVACHIMDSLGRPVTNNWHPHPICFWGCGAAIRRAALRGQPYMFDPRLFLHGTEMDLSVRLYAAGYLIRYCRDAVVHHRFSLQNRTNSARIYFVTQSAARFALKHMPMPLVLFALGRHMAYLFVTAVIKGQTPAYLAAVYATCREIRFILSERRPVPKMIARVYYAQVWEYEPLFLRACRLVFHRPKGRRDQCAGFSDLAELPKPRRVTG